MSATELREAAKEMRERAEKAEPGRWKLWGMTVMADPKGTSDVDDCIEVAHAATPSWCDRWPRTWNAKHIAGMHPAVALAVADWLDQTARLHESGSTGPLDMPAALAVATTYLGSAAHAHSP